jgi:hypothetical protein
MLAAEDHHRKSGSRTIGRGTDTVPVAFGIYHDDLFVGVVKLLNDLLGRMTFPGTLDR